MKTNVGKTLRALREMNKLSTRKLAGLSGVSAGLVSHIENCHASPTVSTLQSIIYALGMTLEEFFRKCEKESSHNDNVSKHEIALNQRVGTRELKIIPVAGEKTDKKIQMFYEIYGPKGDTGSKMLRHGGEEIGICLKGRLQLIIKGKAYDIKPGQYWHFPSTSPHRFRNAGNSIAVLISANTPPTF